MRLYLPMTIWALHVNPTGKKTRFCNQLGFNVDEEGGFIFYCCSE